MLGRDEQAARDLGIAAALAAQLQVVAFAMAVSGRCSGTCERRVGFDIRCEFPTLAE
jgi:hypothetical protein